MDGWDSPRRSRTFLAAALLTAACGLVVRWEEPLPRLNVAEDSAIARSARRQFGRSAEGAPHSAAAEEDAFPLADETLPADERLHDAVAGLGSTSWTPAAARTAAFSGAAGKAPFGAFAPAAAPGAAAARHAGAAMGRRAPENAHYQAAATGTTGGAARSARPARPAPGAESNGGSSAVWSSTASRRGTIDLDRFFSGPGASPASSSRGVKPAGTSTSAPARAPRARAPGRAKTPRFKPVLLSRLLGARALKAPVGVGRPKENPWKNGKLAVPAAAPDGRAITPTPLGIPAAEEAVPPEACRKAAAHWHAQPGLDWLHEDARWGRWDGASWAWLERESGRWWLWPSPQRGALLRHQDHWWLQSRGAWFLLHQGEPWGYRYLSEWGREGLEHASGAQMVYSADGSRVGLIVPGEGAVLFDAFTGAELGRWDEEQMPARRIAAPSRLPALP